MSFNSGVHPSKMTNMFLVVCLFCPLLFLSGQAHSTPPASSAAALYKFTASDNCNTTRATTLRFRKEVGLNFMIKAMQTATDNIFQVFQQQNIAERKFPVGTKLHMEVHDDLGNAVGYYHWDKETNTQKVFVSAAYLDPNIPSANLPARVQELVSHELTHVWQFYGDESSPNPPSKLFEGIADYVPLVTGLKNYAGNKAGQGTKWNEGYEVTAYFLAYCDSLRPGFVASLNKSMRVKYDENYFKAVLGKPVGDLWMDYKRKYAQPVKHGARSMLRDVSADDK